MHVWDVRRRGSAPWTGRWRRHITGEALVRGRAASPYRRVTAATGGRRGCVGESSFGIADDTRIRGRGDWPIASTNRGGNLVPPGPRHRSPAAGQIARAAGGNKPEPAVAAAGSAHRRIPT